MFSILPTILLIIFVPVCILLILIVLLQAGKGGGLAGAFGGGGGQTFLGARGAADFLGKLTIYLAIGFMFIALVLSLTYGKGSGGGINIEEEPAAGIEAPAEADDTNAIQEDTAGSTEQPQTPANAETEKPSSDGN